MAQRRMFSSEIVQSDAFLDMPHSAQALYFHLGMNADDEGFLGNPKRIIKGLNSQEDDFNILLAKRFVIAFESGVIVIKHWLMHNTIRMDRFRPTNYTEEKALLFVKDNRGYTLENKGIPLPATKWQPKSAGWLPQVKLSEDKIREVSSATHVSERGEQLRKEVEEIAQGKRTAHENT